MRLATKVVEQEAEINLLRAQRDAARQAAWLHTIEITDLRMVLEWICEQSFDGETGAQVAIEMQRRAGKVLAMDRESSCAATADSETRKLQP